MRSLAGKHKDHENLGSIMLSLLFLVIWTSEVVHCEKLCDGNNFCPAQDNRYSLADMSYVPHYRRLNASTTRQTNESSVHYNKGSTSKSVYHSLNNESLSPKVPVFSTEGKTSSTSKEDAALLKNLNATLEVIREFSRSARFSDFVERMDEEHHDEHHHGNDTDEDDDGACSNVELSWGEHCYFLTKDPVPGYRAATACTKLFSTAEFSEIENEEINNLVTAAIKQLNSHSQRPIHLRLAYVYIKDNRHNTQYRQTKYNAEEESFKKNICDLVGCQCTALRVSTGTWHSRICDTRHHALCRRPHAHPEDDGKSQKVSTESTVIVHDTEETSTAASSAASWSLIVAAVVTLAAGPRLLSAVQL